MENKTMAVVSGGLQPAVDGISRTIGMVLYILDQFNISISKRLF